MASRTTGHICQHCGNEFEGWSGNPNKYCTPKCSTNATKNGKKYSKEERPDLFCVNCDDKLGKEKSQQLYSKGKDKNPTCSESCRYESVREIRECKYCGNEFKVRKSLPNIFCSPECNTHSQKNEYEERNCIMCGSLFKVNTYSEKRKCKKCVDKSPKRMSSGILTNKEARRVAQKFRSRKSVKKIDRHYVLTCIRNQIGVWIPDIPQELIELKRLNIKRKRKLKEITHGSSQ